MKYDWPSGSTVLASLLLLVLAIAGCSGGDPDPGTGTAGLRDFPAGFLFGAATAGFQSDMGCPTLPAAQCDDPHSDWYAFVTSPAVAQRWGRLLSGDDPSEVGPGHWELYETDLALAREEGRHNAFRMSIEWSRIFPDSTIGVEGHEALGAAADAGAVAHYHEVFASMRRHGLTPLVTLHHYTLPLWIHDGVGCSLNLEGCTERGWLDREKIVREIAKYAGFVAAEFGAEVDLWGTLNEPYAVLLSGYLLPTQTRSNPPMAFLNAEGFKTAYAAMIEAHARMYDAVKANDTRDRDGDGIPSQVGIVYAVAPVRPMNPEIDLDRRAAENVFHLWNTAYLDAVALGEYDANLDGTTVFRPDLAGRMDFLGMNYKVRIAVEGIERSLLPRLSPLATFNPLTLDIGEVYTRGIHEMALLLHDRYGLPIIVTENNGQNVPAGDMEAEIRLLVENLTWLGRAIAEGADVRGYFYWSLTDNYEWNHGMSVPLGLYRVDPHDPLKRRVPRETVPVLAAVAGSGRIPPELAARYPVE